MNPEYTAMLSGLVFSTATLAFKTGAGQFQLLSKIKSGLFRSLALTGFSVSYLVIFAAAFWVVNVVDLSNHSSLLENIIRFGATFHILFSLFLIVYGFHLLRHHGTTAQTSRPRGIMAGLILVLPCPVCATAIFLTISFLDQLFPAYPLLSCTASFAAFTLFSLLTVGALTWWKSIAAINASILTGRLMICVGLYFILTLVIAPQFAKMDEIFRVCSATETHSSPPGLIWVGLIGLFFLISGFSFQQIKTIKIRKSQCH